ncbi:ABC-2 type transport system permease protein [Prevotellaceae bacterium MN60]|nr:ABC-2 type transport system permease protein [Prevotellaceae bacterium MN60]
MKRFRQIYLLAVRECKMFLRNPIYISCMVVFPLLVMFFFTSLMEEGQPTEMPVGVVDLDNSSTTRSLVRRLDAFQTSHVVAHYPSVAEARAAMQNNEIYAFMYIPKGTTECLLSSRQPKISFYYSMTTLLSGSLLYRDLKTISVLGSAAVGQATMRAKGYTDGQIQTFLQPIRIDLHQISNATTDYNDYLSTVLVPGVMMLFIFLITAYAIGTELKFRDSHELVRLGGNNIWIALIGKFLPHMLLWLALTFGYSFYVFIVMGFPHPGGLGMIVLLNLLMVFSSMGFGIFAFGLMPSLRMSMSVCSLWAVLSFSMAGAAFPVMGMDGPLQSLAWLFPLRHYYMVYQTCILNDFSILDAWWNVAALLAFMLMPIIVAPKMKNALLTYVYIP